MASLVNNGLVRYLREAREELGKVAWPTRADTARYTVAIIVLCAVLAAYFGLVDFGLTRGLDALVHLVSKT